MTTTAAPEPTDPHQWLEEVIGDDALTWVRERNARAEAEIGAWPAFAELEADLLAILDSEAKIPVVEKRGEWYYNLWQDSANPRGRWRRTTLESYRSDEPAWETVLDLDALNAAEGENWVWHGAEFLRPAFERCLVFLSRGGADAHVMREFDVTTRQFVDGGFFLPEAKGSAGWVDGDTLFVQTDFGPGTMTASGYPRLAKRWRRGTALDSATTVFAGETSDIAVDAEHDPTPGFERDFVRRAITFYTDELYQLAGDGALVKLDLPDSAIKGVARQWLTVQLRDDWQLGGVVHPAGSYLVTDLDAFAAGERAFTVLFEPTERTSLVDATWTRHHLVLNVLDDVKTRLTVLTPGPDDWARSPFPGVPSLGTVVVAAVDPDESDDVWVTSSDFLTPTTLSIARAGEAPQPLKAMPAYFDATGHTAEQRFAVSADGTRVPYFVVSPRDGSAAGDRPTLLYGYGGFEVSMLPAYSATIGKAWLERGGTYVVANLRGGGEYGPRWHAAALRENRPRAYEDFAAVARALIDGGVTSPRRLGTMGGSNGGLLMGNMITEYPELFGAIVVQVPLLDMRRYHRLLAGASWMGEYGDPDRPEEWAFIQTFSPYHRFDPARPCPPVLFTTSTRDDRVHPGHARKMMAMMEAAGKDVRAYENIEGGHGGAADNRQRAHMTALAMAFLWQQLAG